MLNFKTSSFKSHSQRSKWVNFSRLSELLLLGEHFSHPRRFCMYTQHPENDYFPDWNYVEIQTTHVGWVQNQSHDKALRKLEENSVIFFSSSSLSFLVSPWCCEWKMNSHEWIRIQGTRRRRKNAKPPSFNKFQSRRGVFSVHPRYPFLLLGLLVQERRWGNLKNSEWN